MLALLLLALAFMPAQAMSRAWEGEREMVRALGGEAFDAWILSEGSAMLSGWGETATSLADEIASHGMGKPAVERIYIVFVWLNLIVFRLMSLVLWLLAVSPVVLALSIDGYYVREIRKESFVAQSPIRHKAGAWLMQLTILVMAIWLLIPAAIPPVVAPFLLAMFGVSSWLWISNLQKRI
jgi:hypothetical protein